MCKTCNKCNITYEDVKNNFHKRLKSFYHMCKKCKSIYNEEYRLKNKGKITYTSEKSYKEKISEYHKKYYKNNKEKVTERNRKYYENNKQRLSEHSKKYRKNNKEKVTEYYKKYCEDNKEKILDLRKKYSKKYKYEMSEYYKKYSKNNKEKIAAMQKKYYENNKEKYVQYYSVNYFLRAASLNRKDVTPNVVEVVETIIKTKRQLKV